ncbi:hypothetical protein N7499_011267 [Penicillium canescens]|uniref:Uncharacterized protein n=1 Tax=Penicillium canescens TaxID=5083 RepID=A0AAD6IJU8_PENCN|nr:uncharacterized protein N7446_006525 [Penicillium canescens]KAJ5990722.1 hypothetical protein N7522_010929 [Penicillium canescens]KAJ6051888.1 hypothetical protein N7460_002422 [Penicillium canescens]KAJ6062405.1 hypothetical protein N7446_006525 [Penicillium canescens]KAJ6065652.1 hypothetical protein N7444_001305 [Penicillium canescens]KAJ6069380.1 hypothetical protein N7499_011267 [Penicillium canescens]
MARIPPGDMPRQQQRSMAIQDDTAILLAEFQSDSDLLARDVPSRFILNIGRVRKEIPSLCSRALPFVLSHRALNVINLLTSPETRNITGIVD